MNVFLNLIRWIFIIPILIFALATFMGQSYLQTAILVLAVIFLAWWPGIIKKFFSKTISKVSRIVMVLALLIIGFTQFPPGPKTSIYISPEAKFRIMEIYDNQVTKWPGDTQDLYVETEYGRVHVLACGDTSNPPLLMFHAASMGAHSWFETLPPILDKYRIYAVDNPGEGNRSELYDPNIFPEDGKAIADLYAEIANKLNVDHSPVFGASNGGYIAMSYALHHPEKVESLALFGPMGLTPLTGKSIMMLSVASMYPFQFIQDEVTHWALGKNPIVLDAYGDWFNNILYTMPSVAQPIPLTREEKEKISIPVILFLGTNDPIVGDAAYAVKLAGDFPDIKIETLPSGHLIAVEKADTVNASLIQFLNIKSR